VGLAGVIEYPLLAITNGGHRQVIPGRTCRPPRRKHMTTPDHGSLAEGFSSWVSQAADVVDACGSNLSGVDCP
jgi:hypothetical protein